jgi:GntR family transcriptional regulator
MHTQKQSFLDGLRLERSGVPIYVQLREHVLRAIAAGVLAPGDRMPTMRLVAVTLKVDLNTVRHAYEELERAGALVLIHGRGSFVADLVPAGAAPLAQTADPLEVLARQTLAAAAALGVDPPMLIQRIAALAALKDPVT